MTRRDRTPTENGRPIRTDGGDPEAAGDEGYDEWLAAVDEGEGYYLRCPQEHGSLPPRTRCPHCGSGELVEASLPETGTVETLTETQVPIPSFEDDAPYRVAIASFGEVRLTGQLRGDGTQIGDDVRVDVGERETTGEPLVVFHPA